MLNRLATVALIVLLGGCTTVPPQIFVTNKDQLINFVEVSDISVGKSVRWGGVISDLSKQNGLVNATVTQFPLLNSGQPTNSSGSGGRFAVKFETSQGISHIEKGTILSLIGKVVDVQNPYPNLTTTQLATVQADGFFVWDSFSSADHPVVLESPAFIPRGKWGWQIKSDKDKKRERQERTNERNSRH